MLLPLIREAEGKHVWLPEKDGKSLLPHYCDTYGKVADYLAAHPELTGKVWDEIRSELEGGRGRFLLHRGDKLYHMQARDALSLLPIDTSRSEKAASFLGGKKVQKLFLLSGTISRTDVEQMALQGKRVVMLQAHSPISVERRPIIKDYVATMSYMNQQDPEVLESLVDRIVHYARQHDGKVLVHAPYSLAARIGPLLSRLLPGRVLSHSNHDKAAALRRFREDPQPWVLLGSGLEEGVDLYGEQYTLQLICKVPFPGLGDPAWKWVAEEQPERYAWEAIKKVVQAAGRICRGPDDYGKTVILDQAFDRLLTKHRDLLPQYFTEALLDGTNV
jgi:Rad3-related DNA helicase